MIQNYITNHFKEKNAVKLNILDANSTGIKTLRLLKELELNKRQINKLVSVGTNDSFTEYMQL